MFKRIFSCFLILPIILSAHVSAGNTSVIESVSQNTDLALKSGSACLMDAESGTIIYEHNADEKLEPASVTKVMTLLLAMEALADGLITLDTKIVASKNASQMGGSQIWLEYGEEMSFDEMLKAIVVVSANDCTVALAEHLCGSEEAFVTEMNKKAQNLGMTNTTFKNCTGLPADNHLTTAKDIAIMTRELSKHKTIFNYTTIWMDTLRGGEMGLSNTNKLIRFYKGATGMKTGFTASALYCLSATASRDNLELIATVMKAKSSDERFEDAKKLLDFGFANFGNYTSKTHELPNVKITQGVESELPIKYSEISILVPKNKIQMVEESIVLPEFVVAPVNENDIIGKISYLIDGKIVGSADIMAGKTVEKARYFDIIAKIFKKLIIFR